MEKLPEAADATAKKWAVVFDFDTDACYPSPAISKSGEINPGRGDNSNTKGCREPGQLENSNCYYRRLCIEEGGDRYCVHMYALYFMKDVNFWDGHRHDWEFALAWTKNDILTHGSCSAHGGVETRAKSGLYFDTGKENSVKIVYHAATFMNHSLRFAKKDEAPENYLRKWFTPTLVDWYKMSGEGDITNSVLRNKLNKHDFGSGNCSFNDGNFPNEISKAVPDGYPDSAKWKAAAWAAVLEDYLLGDYECHLPGEEKNDWHYVTLSKAGKTTFQWTNRAGVSWTLNATSEKDKLDVGQECPYFEQYRQAKVLWQWNNNSQIFGIRGPGNELYIKSSMIDTDYAKWFLALTIDGQRDSPTLYRVSG